MLLFLRVDGGAIIISEQTAVSEKRMQNQLMQRGEHGWTVKIGGENSGSRMAGRLKSMMVPQSFKFPKQSKGKIIHQKISHKIS